MEIRISQKTVKQLNKIPEPVFTKIKQKIENLAQNPFPPSCKRLVNWPGFRIRVGDYRILYKVDQEERVVIIYRVAHRREAYR